MRVAASPAGTPIRASFEVRKIMTNEPKAGPARVFVSLAFAVYATLICEWLHVLVT